MRSRFARAPENCRIYYGPASDMVYSEPEKMTREGTEEKGGTRAVQQIPQMPIMNIPPDFFGLDEVDRAELRRMEPNAARDLAPYIRRENIMRQLGTGYQPGGYLEEVVTLMLLSEIFDRRRRCRRRGVCGR